MAVVLVFVALAAAIGRPGGVVGRGGPVVLEIVETNSQGLRHLPLNQAPSLDDVRGESPNRRRGAVRSGGLRVGYQAEAAGVRIFSHWYSPRRLPWRLPLGAPLVAAGRVVAADLRPAAGGEEVNVVDNAGRLIPGDVLVRAVDAAGRVSLTVAGGRVDLGPGDSWTGVWVLAAGGGDAVAARPGPAVDRALADGRPVTRLTVVNRGRDRMPAAGSRSRPPTEGGAGGR